MAHRWLLVDVSGLLYRAHFSLGQLTSPSGEHTGALYGFIRSLLKVEKQVHPNTIIAIFDGPHNKQSRLALFSDYKAQRKPTPHELIHQIHEAQRFCSLWGMPMLAVEGVEADDVIATVAHRALQDPEAEVIICSHDKDLFQLLEPRIRIFNPSKETMIDAASFTKEWEIEPKQCLDYFAIVGDDSDNIPGIEGLGPKTALSLLQTYGSLDAIYDHINDFSGKKRERIENSKDIAYLSRTLVKLCDTVPLPENFTAERAPIQKEQTEQFFQEKGFRTLLQLIPGESAAKDQTRQFMPQILQTKESLQTFIQSIPSHGGLAIDVETTSLDPQIARLVGIGLAFSEEEKDVGYIPLNIFPIHEVIPLLHNAIIEKELTVIGHNLKFDLSMLKKEGFALPKKIYDTLLASWIMRAHERTHGLDVLVQRYFHIEMIPIESLIGKGKAQTTMDMVPLEQIAPYCGLDAHYAFRLYCLFEKEMTGTPLEFVLKEIEFPLLPVLLEMEETGVYVSKEHLEETGAYIHKKIEDISATIFELVGFTFNLNSPKQLSEILYDQLQLPSKKRRGKEHRSTDAETLEELWGIHPIIEHLLEYRQLEKLRSTYVQALLDRISPKTHRVHCRFMQAGTATGRLSCQEPNLQNIPVKTDLGKRIREAFCAEKPRWKMVSADYSQIELRILAHISQDPFLIDAFKHKKDIHAQTAAQIFHVPLHDVTEEMRRKAKAVNFGMIYGQQAFGLAAELHIPLKEAQEFIDKYFLTYPLVLQALSQLKDTAKEKGYAETLLGRRRAVPDIRSAQFAIKTSQERLAINTPFQGLAADIIKLAMLKVHTVLQERKLKTKMVLQIHDELLFEVPDEELDDVTSIIKDGMEHVLDLSVPLTVEIGIGKNWREC